MLGIIGGTGLYHFEEMDDRDTHTVATPFGSPSADIVVGRMSGKQLAFLPRHGIRHELLPSEINYRANVWALKAVGVTSIVSVSAVGSLARDIEPGDLAVPSQFLDFTKGLRAHTFFGNGIVAHISTATPTCEALAASVGDAARSLGFELHSNRTYACVEGPRLGNRAESTFMQSAGAHLVGMTNVPEVYLAREAQLCYSTVAVVTDYDCWLDDPSAHVRVDRVLEVYRESLVRVRLLIARLIKQYDGASDCTCRLSLQNAVLTPDESLDFEQSQRLAFLRT